MSYFIILDIFSKNNWPLDKFTATYNWKYVFKSQKTNKEFPNARSLITFLASFACANWVSNMIRYPHTKNKEILIIKLIYLPPPYNLKIGKIEYGLPYKRQMYVMLGLPVSLLQKIVPFMYVFHKTGPTKGIFLSNIGS